MDKNKLKDKLYKEYWHTGDLKSKPVKRGITLGDGVNADDDFEFYEYGRRLGEWLAEHMNKYADIKTEDSSVLEIGCGVGRMMLPIGIKSRSITGVDFDPDVLKEAESYLSDLSNFSLKQNNGLDLGAFKDNSFDMVYSTGVMQHIVDFNVIASYMREGLRVCKDNGICLYTFQVWQTKLDGEGRTGAKITAKLLNNALRDINYEIQEINFDPLDPVPHYCVILKKKACDKDSLRRDFSKTKVASKPWRTVAWQGLKTMSFVIKQIGNSRPVTFHD